jgi:hypothetical protein
VPPLADRVGRTFARFKDDRSQTALDQVRGGGQADWPCADDSDRGHLAGDGVRHGGLLESQLTVTAPTAVTSTSIINTSECC